MSTSPRRDRRGGARKPPLRYPLAGGGGITMAELMQRTGQTRNSIYSRISRGWTAEEILSGQHDPNAAPPGDQSVPLEPYTCPRCGLVFVPPLGVDPRQGNNPHKFRAFVRIGGQKVCETCASRRFARNPDSSRPLGANYICPFPSKQ